MKKHHYKIALEVEEGGDTPLEAIQIAMKKFNENPYDYTFVVQNDDTGEIVSIDFSENPADMELPNPNYEPLIVPTPERLENERKRMITHIRDIIKKHGPTSTMELELDSSPCLSTIGNNKDNVSQLVENFNEDTVMCVTYHGEVEIDSERRAYDGLSDHILAEIENIMIDYDSAEEQTYKRISS